MQHFRHSEGENKPTEGAAILNRVFCIAVELSVLLSTSTTFLCILYFCCSFSSFAACQQLISNSLLKTEPRGWPRPEAAVSTSSSSGCACSRENPGGVRAQGRVSGATGNREELWRTGRCQQNDKWCPLRGCRATPQHPLGQQVNARHQGL